MMQKKKTASFREDEMKLNFNIMQKKRTANFREDETKLLIELWGSPTIQNQLQMCHRKAPIMLQLAAAMQQHGFYRTPEEITTRIRNLKCIYHRIKKARHMGIFSTETADWYHFKAIDAILGDNSGPQMELHVGHFSGGIKKEPNVMEVPDSMYNSNSVCSGQDADSDVDGNSAASSPMQGLAITSSTVIAPSSLMTCPTIPEVRLGYHTEDDPTRDQSPSVANYSYHPKRMHERLPVDLTRESSHSRKRPQVHNDNDVSSLLQQLLDVEREHLELEKQRLELDRQVGSQLAALVPLVSNVLQRHQQRSGHPEPSDTPRHETSDEDPLDDETSNEKQCVSLD